MIDTIGIGWQGPKVGQAELDCFRKEINGPIDMKSWIEPGQDMNEVNRENERRWTGTMQGVGKVTLNADGYFRFERSLAKVKAELLDGIDPEQVTNNEVLSASWANETFQALTVVIETRLPFLVPGMMKVQRADICYQRQVKNSQLVLEALNGAVKPTRMGSSWWRNNDGVPTGIILRGKARASRHYDKGLESGNHEYDNVVRSEEQIRKDAVAMGQIVDVSQRIFNRVACRDTVNERFLDVGFDEQLDVSELVRDGKDTVALLIKCPELISLYRERVKPNAYFKMKAQIRKHRASVIPEDLRLPDDAWEEAA